MGDSKLFVSHAVNDRLLIKAFVGLVETGIGVPARNIFCSSLKGQGIKPGAEFKESIREHLDSATCVVAVITPNFYNSPFCMCEMGGVWLQAKSFIPIIVPPLAFADLKAVLIGLQALKIADKADLDELRDEIADRLSLKPLPTPRWNEHREDFLESLPKILKQIPAESPVSHDVHEKALKGLKEYRTEYKKAEEKITKLEALNADLMKIKDSAKAAAAVRKHSSTTENFEALVEAAKDALHRLPSCVKEALYYRARGDDYIPAEWDDVTRAIEDGQLALNAEENGVHPRKSDPRVGKAIKALDELATWLDHPPSDFQGWYEAEYDDSRADLQLRPFWEEHLD